LKLSVLFSYLLKDIDAISRWQGGGGYLVDGTGLILTRTKGAPDLSASAWATAATSCSCGSCRK
jgi:hypothetical protein